MSLVTARYFRVSAKPSAAPDFHDLLLTEMTKPRAERERDITGTGIILRVEDCITEGDFICGQFCRKQVRDIPPNAGPDGLSVIALPEGGGLGHVAAFRYHKPSRVILLQSNAQCAVPSRVGMYLATLNNAAIFNFNPVLRDDALVRLENRKVRSMTVKFSSTENLAALEEQGVAAAKTARIMAAAVDGIELTITVSAGRSRKKFLDAPSVTREVHSLLGNADDLETLTIIGDADAHGRSINFLEENLHCKGDIDLPENDHETHYIKRRLFLQAQFLNSIEFIEGHFVRARP